MGLVIHRETLGPFETHAYLLFSESSRECAVVDVGFDPERVVAMVNSSGARLRYLLNTHAHYDHLAGMRGIQGRLAGEWWMHPADRFLADALAEQGAAFGLPPERAPDDLHGLVDGQRLPLGTETLEVIHTPGHSPGSVTFRWDDVLISGDVLFAGSIGRTDLPGGSFEELTRSIRERLFPLGDHLRVLPGHGPETTIGVERVTNPFVADEAGGRG
jgi:glyoxylase-like metal-dependent hydrolase (beta-lactamase superfamily II)